MTTASEVLHILASLSPSKMVFTGAMIAALGATIVALGTYLSSREQSKNREALLKATIENKDLSNKNVALSEQLRMAITGGDSYPHGIFTRSIHYPPDRLFLTLVVRGPHPIYDARITLQDTTVPIDQRNVETREGLAAELDKRHVELFRSAQQPTTYHANSDAMIASVVLKPEETWKSYALTVHARNGRFTEHIELQRTEQGWRNYKHKIRKATNGDDVILEEYDGDALLRAATIVDLQAEGNSEK